MKILFLFDKKYLYFIYLKNSKYVIKYTEKRIYLDIFDKVDIILAINTILKKDSLIKKRNIPLISFSNFYIYTQNYGYSFICIKSNINQVYIFYLFILLYFSKKDIV